MTGRKTPVTAFSIPVALRDDLRVYAAELTGRTRVRISMAAVVAAALKVSREHPDEMIAALTAQSGDEA